MNQCSKLAPSWEKLEMIFFLLDNFSNAVFVSGTIANLYGIIADIIVIQNSCVWKCCDLLAGQEHSNNETTGHVQWKKEIFIGCLGVHRRECYALQKRTRYKVNASSLQR